MKRWLNLLALLSFSLAWSAAEAPLQFSDLSGKLHTPLVVDGKKAAVLIFISPYCPTENAFVPEVNQIAAKYGNTFAFYYVHADSGISLADAKKQADTSEIKTTVLLDPEQKLAKLTHAKTTPEAVVLDSAGKTLYQGRINDLYASQTKKLKEPSTHDLRNALDAIQAGKPVEVPVTKAIGCSISGVK